MVPKLIVLTGLPGSGKSSIANILRDKNHFTKFSLDDFRKSSTNLQIPAIIKDPMRYSALIRALRYGTHSMISEGYDAVVDATNPNSTFRDLFLDTQDIPADKYLVHINTDLAVRESRIALRGYKLDLRSQFEEIWEDPVENNCQLITYSSNTRDDLSLIRQDLASRF